MKSARYLILLIVFLFSVVNVAWASKDYCPDIVGAWHGSSGNVDITQYASHEFSGSMLYNGSFRVQITGSCVKNKFKGDARTSYNRRPILVHFSGKMKSSHTLSYTTGGGRYQHLKKG